jgi:hypothetical protein
MRGQANQENVLSELAEKERLLTAAERMALARMASAEHAIASKQILHSPEPANVDNPQCDATHIVVCESINVKVPINAEIITKSRYFREVGGDWLNSERPFSVIGWCDWIGDINVTADGHDWVVSVSFKNWKHDRNREFKLDVEFTRP